MKPLTEFHRRSKTDIKLGYLTECRSCRSATFRESYNTDPQKRDQQYRKKYGITVAEYEEMFAAQQGCCMICNRPDVGGKRLNVDHDHDTGQARGLLCRACNRGIGMFGDDPELVMAAADYLLKFKDVLRGSDD